MTMLDTWLDRSERNAILERIDQQAKEIDPRRVAMTLLALPLFVLGYVVASVCKVVWMVGTWMWVAMLAGWQTQRTPRRDDDHG